MEENNNMLAPPVPAVSQLRAEAEAGGQMERSLSADIREEREDLREAAEQTLNVIMDLSLEGVINWVSPSWTDVIGTTLESVQGKVIKDLLVSDNKEVFSEIVESMKKDDSRSQIIRFSVQLGPASKLAPIEIPAELRVETPEGTELQDEPATIDLEGQGIMVYDRSSGLSSHVSYVSDAGGGINANVRFRQCG
jgi:serine/threonine-protein kinase RIM15